MLSCWAPGRRDCSRHARSEAGKRGRRVAILERAERAGKKILISRRRPVPASPTSIAIAGQFPFRPIRTSRNRRWHGKHAPAGLHRPGGKTSDSLSREDARAAFSATSVRGRHIEHASKHECRAAGVQIILGKAGIREAQRTTEFVWCGRNPTNSTRRHWWFATVRAFDSQDRRFYHGVWLRAGEAIPG